MLSMTFTGHRRYLNILSSSISLSWNVKRPKAKRRVNIRMSVKHLMMLTCAYIGYFSCNCQDFGYDGSIGPSHWSERYGTCMGKHQSPVDIEEDNVRMITFPPLKFENFEEPLDEVEVKNNGHTVVLTISEGKMPRLFGGPLKASYAFSQLHFHWGNNDTEGSENMINNHSFPMELHMVFYRENYNTFNLAANLTDGLTVLSFLYQATNEENENYKQFENELSKVHNLGSSSVIKQFVPLRKFTIKDHNTYFTYTGSLTTPPCSEVVTWIEFKETIPLSHEQIQAFRLLYGETGQLTHNFRPTQPLYDRIIYMNSSSNFARDDKIFLTIMVVINVLLLNGIN